MIRLPDELADDPRWEPQRLGGDGFFLHVAAIMHSCRAQSDGCLTRSRARRLTPVPDPDSLIDGLVAEGAWAEDGPDELRIVLAMEHQFTSQQVKDYRTKEAAKKARQRKHNAEDHSMCTRGPWCPDGQLEPRRAGVSRGDNKGDTTGDSTRESEGVSVQTKPSQAKPYQAKPSGLGLGMAGLATGADPAPGARVAPSASQRQGTALPPPIPVRIVMPDLDGIDD